MIRPIYGSNNATELLLQAQQIFKKMTENADMFPNPVPDLATFETLLTNYQKAYLEAQFRDQRTVIIKGQLGRELQEAIYRLSTYVDSVALGDPGIIVAAGYQPRQSPANRIERTPKAENLRATHMEVGSGIVRLRINPWKHARLYRYEYRLKGTAEWDTVLHSKSFIDLKDLVKLQEYEFRASYVGRDIEPNFSNTISALVV
ncbi:hypothetical protein G5B30_07045 [Sphingobacterium sp. SGG-5]|uniref:hypothetical protein n=1 Tax=Sphingobacterium sp. SGG-5 TaxID=2710881 RepID=UPI0013EDAD67|nr:hypothetical protein [Sphingobacterium sp. SGG-5]NGM61672.1 hypothetical protein [Sphingobacterium sp. SGG-5]